ncbi:hypothetical protein ACFXNW_26220 [Nocardia sp. NPDC059180]|uniref:hypothetical protein n=1 Tax=Nocardia sp. NPDC059180 TaxID=3346761 RepID=UPI0036AC2D37
MQRGHRRDIDGLCFAVQLVQIFAANIAEQAVRNARIMKLAVKMVIGQIFDTVARRDRFRTLIAERDSQSVCGGIEFIVGGQDGT